MPPEVITLAGSTALIAKVAVDMVRMAAPEGYELKPWMSPVLAVLFGFVGNVLMLLAVSTPLTSQNLAVAGLASFLAAAGAVGATELQKRAA